MNLRLRFVYWTLATLSLWYLPQAQAGLAMSSTRMVLTAGKPEQTLFLSNNYSYPILLQVWTGDGSHHSTPDTETSPVITVPPIFRMDSGGEQGVRLILDGSPLPAGKESLFWLNLYEVPALPATQLSEEAVRVQVATRTQMKVFVRPEGVEASLDDVAGKLQFHVMRKAEGWSLICTNGSVLHASFAGAQVQVNGKATELYGTHSMMVAPGESSSIPLSYPGEAVEQFSVNYSLINDLGQVVDYSYPMTGIASEKANEGGAKD